MDKYIIQGCINNLRHRVAQLKAMPNNPYIAQKIRDINSEVNTLKSRLK
jgi:hypothetical protein